MSTSTLALERPEAELTSRMAGPFDDALRAALEALLMPHGQEHVLQYWDELSEDQRLDLSHQLLSIDLNQLDRLIEGDVAVCDAEDLSGRVGPPPAKRLGQNSSTQSARRTGEEALRSGQTGVVIVAGGQGSRLGFPHPKGMYPIGPVTSAPLFRILIEKIRGVAMRYGTHIPLYLMTSPATHQETVDYLSENDRFGLAEDDLFVFCQGTMPAVDEATGKLLLASKGSLFLCPDGHGGMLAALQSSGALNDARRRGIEHLFYTQVDNALVNMLDPDFLGHHLLADSDVTTQVVAKQAPGEKVGNVVSVDGRLQIIEYSDLPDELAERRAGDGSLELWAGNIAVHALSVAFLQDALNGNGQLPFHVAHKKIPHITRDGNVFEPEAPNGIKFEQFIFDLLPLAPRSLVVEVSEEEVFAPLKNASGSHSPDDVKRRITSVYRRWLTEAGIPVDPESSVEISPLLASSADDLRSCEFGRVEHKDGTLFESVATS